MNDLSDSAGRSRSSSFGSRTSAYSQISQLGRRFNSVVSVNDVMQGIQKLSDRDHVGSERLDFHHHHHQASPIAMPKSMSEKKQHTVMSRWAKLKTIVGVKSTQLSGGSNNASARDYDSIYTEWSMLCGNEGFQLTKEDKISREFEKRKKQSVTKDAKSKLDLRDCDLNDDQIKLLVRALAHTPKISTLDLRGNNKVTEESKKVIDHLNLCQLEASRRVGSEASAVGMVFMSDVKWNISGDSHSESSSVGAGSQNGSFSSANDLEESREKIKIEIDHGNAKSHIKGLYLNETAQGSTPLDTTGVKKLWRKVVGSNSNRMNIFHKNYPGVDVLQDYDGLERLLLWGLIDCGKLKSLSDRLELDMSFEVDEMSSHYDDDDNESFSMDEHIDVLENLTTESDSHSVLTAENLSTARNIHAPHSQLQRINEEEDEDEPTIKGQMSMDSMSMQVIDIDTEEEIVPRTEQDFHKEESSIITLSEINGYDNQTSGSVAAELEPTTNMAMDGVKLQQPIEKLQNTVDSDDDISQGLLAESESLQSTVPIEVDNQNKNTQRNHVVDSDDETVEDVVHEEIHAVEHQLAAQGTEEHLSVYNIQTEKKTEVEGDALPETVIGFNLQQRLQCADSDDETIDSAVVQDSVAGNCKQHPFEQVIEEINTKPPVLLQETAAQPSPPTQSPVNSPETSPAKSEVIVDGSPKKTSLQRKRSPNSKHYLQHSHHSHIPLSPTRRPSQLEQIHSMTATETGSTVAETTNYKENEINEAEPAGSQYRGYFSPPPTKHREDVDLEIFLSPDNPEIAHDNTCKPSDAVVDSDEEYNNVAKDILNLHRKRSESAETPTATPDLATPTPPIKQGGGRINTDPNRIGKISVTVDKSYSPKSPTPDNKSKSAPLSSQRSSSPRPISRANKTMPLTSPKRISPTKIFSSSSPKKALNLTDKNNSPQKISGDSKSNLSPKLSKSQESDSVEVKALHPAFRRHDGRHKTPTTTASQQFSQLQRVRSMAESTACVLVTSHRTSTSTMTSNPLLSSVANIQTVIEASNPSPTKRRQPIQTKLISNSVKDIKLSKDSSSVSSTSSSRLDLSRGNRTTQDMKFQNYVKPEQFKQITTILLHHNLLTLVDRLFLSQRFPNLTELDLSNNSIATNLTTACFPISLVKLDLSHNEIKSIKELSGLVNLRELNVAHNKIRTIDPLPRVLSKLDISHNWIREIDAFSVLFDNVNLQWLNIMHNEIPDGYLKASAKELMKNLPNLACSPVDFDALYMDYDVKTVYKAAYKESEMKQLINRLAEPSPERHRKTELEEQLEFRQRRIQRLKEKSAYYHFAAAHVGEGNDVPIYERYTASYIKHIEPKPLVRGYKEGDVSVSRSRSASPVKSRSSTPTYNNQKRATSKPTMTVPVTLSKTLTANTASSKTREALRKQEDEEIRKRREIEQQNRSRTPVSGLTRNSSRSSIVSRGGSITSRSTLKSGSIAKFNSTGLHDEDQPSAIGQLMGNDDMSNVSANSSITGTLGNSTIVTKESSNLFAAKDNPLNVSVGSTKSNPSSLRSTPSTNMFANQKVVSLEALLGGLDG